MDFALARFDNGDDTYGGVRYPMRLIIDRGSLGRVAAALDAATPPAEPGIYPLTLVIYDSDGDQVFSASCLAATPSTDADPALPPPPVTTEGACGEYRSRQGGDYGVFELCRVPVAAIDYRPMPPDFVLPVSGGYYGVACGGAHGQTTEAAGRDYWVGDVAGRPIVISSTASPGPARRPPPTPSLTPTPSALSARARSAEKPPGHRI